MLPKDLTKDIKDRLSSIKGQVEGIIKMLDESDDPSQILNQFNLSCNNTYAYLMDGMYPIDIVHLNKVAQNKEGQQKTYTDYASEILHEDKIPWFFTPELKILILAKSNTYILKNT